MKNKCNMRPKKDLRDTRGISIALKKQLKQLSPAVITKLKNLKTMLNQQDTKCWEIGDLCIELIDEHHLSLRQIGEFTDYSRARISHFHLTSRTFMTNQRTSYTFQDSLTARQIHRKLPRLDLSPAEIRDVIVKLRNKTPTQVCAYFINILTEQERNQHLAQSAQSYIYKDKLINNCHHADWRNIIPKLPDGSVQLIIADPPFVTSSGYISKRAETNALRTDCDHGTTEDQALGVTLPLFELCLAKLSPEGALLLFQGGGKPDRIEVLQKAHECGWQCLNALTWEKGHLSAGSFQNPYLISTERILIFTRTGVIPKKYQNGLSNPDVLHFPTETQHATRRMHSGKLEYGNYHMFQKPPALMEFLIQHHSFPGDLVVEPFGCSGSGVIAASKLNRQWVYIESNLKNYTWGSKRVMKAVSEQSVQAG